MSLPRPSDEPATAVPDRDAAVFRLIYRSRDQIPAEHRREQLGAIFSTARSTNKAHRITGALLVAQGWFVQALEGAEDEVRRLFDKIAVDDRHDQVQVLATGEVPGRVFGRWSMAQVSSEGGADIPLIAGTHGVLVAAGHPVTAEQEQVLDAMRAATRSSATVG